jgi:hypothetical protein
MIKQNIYTIKCILDLMIIFCPFILLLDGGAEKFVFLFYIVYLPSLIFNVIEIRYKKNELLFKKSVPIRNQRGHGLKKTKSEKKELFISQ